MRNSLKHPKNGDFSSVNYIHFLNDAAMDQVVLKQKGDISIFQYICMCSTV